MTHADPRVGRVLGEHFVMPKVPGWRCACGARFGFSDTAIAHVAAALAAADIGVITDARKYAAKCAAETVRVLDREVDLRAEAWDEGYDARGRDIADEGLTASTVTPNPYRDVPAKAGQ